MTRPWPKYFLATCLMLMTSGCGGGGGSGGGADPGPITVAPPPPPPPPPASCPNALGDGTNLRKDGNDCIASFRDSDGAAYDARQLVGTDSWVVESPDTLDGLLVYGQSNAGLAVGTDTDSRLRRPLFPRTVLGSSLGFTGNGHNALPNAGAAPFRDLFDAPSLAGHFPATLDAYAAEQFSRDSGRAPSGIYAYTQYEGGQPIGSFVRGSVNYENLLADVRRTAASALLYKRRYVVRAVVWVHGETASPDYGATLERLADDLAADIRSITGQSERPELLVQQVNAPDAMPRLGMESEQLELARRRHETGVTLIGPMYQARFGAGDIIHVSDIGKMALADVVGLVFDRIRRGRRFTPLWPVGTSRNGATIDVRFSVPGNGLAFDQDFVPPVPGQGFIYWEGASQIPIRSLEIVGQDTVRITLDRVPAGVGRLDYALGNETTVDGYAAGRGNLFSEDGATSVFARLGYPVPRQVRHYAVRFQMSVP